MRMSLTRPRSLSDTGSAGASSPKRQKSSSRDSTTFQEEEIDGDSPYIQKIKSPLLNIRVGPNAITYQIHKKILTDAAEYFEKMFDGQFAEAAENSAEFPEDDVDAWEAFIEWCYNDTLPGLPTKVDSDGNKEQMDPELAYDFF